MPDRKGRDVRRSRVGDEGGEGLAAEAGSSPRLYQRVVAILDSQIRQGAIAADAALTETAVAARFGISRAPARRALVELQRAGLIARSDPRGFIVVAGRRDRRAGRQDRDAIPLEMRDFKLVSQPSWARIYGAVESEVIARISFASWRLNEVELARHYGVSRTVARDVLSRLQQRGVVQKDDRSRWTAPALSAEHVGELYELRWILEPVALGKAAPNLPPAVLAQVRRNLDDAIAHAHEIGGETLDRLERDLHVTLLGYCGNRALAQAITSPQSLIVAHRFLYRWTSHLFPTEPFLPEHLEVIERLQAGRTADAAKALETHLRVSPRRIMARIDAVATGPQPEPLPYLDRLPRG
jgi:DNA-binding GntR family transcriptional regulator